MLKTQFVKVHPSWVAVGDPPLPCNHNAICGVGPAKHQSGNGVARAVQHSRMPERTLKRRFKVATGLSFIEYLQNLRIEEAKRLLESSTQSADEISAEVGYQDPSFFRRLFSQRTGMTPGRYRQMFQRMGVS